MENTILVIVAAFGFLQLILFFKIWGMTNDIREIKNKYLYSEVTSTNDSISDGSLREGMLVVDLKTEKQMRVGQRTDDGKYKCYDRLSHVGDFTEYQIMEFEKWVELKK